MAKVSKESFDSINSVRRAGHRTKFPWHRFVILLFAGIAAIAGTVAALSRSNLPTIINRAPLADAHGAIMVFGFLGTAISMERSVAFRAGSASKPKWGFIAPILSALGVFVFMGEMLRIVPMPAVWQLYPATLWALSMLMLSAVYIGIWFRQHSMSVIIQVMGSFVGFCGAALWARGINASILAPWWMVFLTLTIVGERLELSHATVLDGHVEPTLLSATIAIVLSLPIQLMMPSIGFVCFGLSMGVLLVTMLINDTARRTWNKPRLTGFMGTCMLVGYVWAILASLVWVFAPNGGTDYWADFSIHALAIGFVLSMVAAHVCVIVPAIVRRPMPYHWVIWIPWGILQLGLLLRFIGTVQTVTLLWQVGDAINVAGVLCLMICIVGLTIYGSRKAARRVHMDLEREKEASQIAEGK